MRDIFAWILNLLAWISTHVAWICTLTAGFAVFAAVAIPVLFPIEAARNRGAYAIVDQYAHWLAATHRVMPTPKEDGSTPRATFKGLEIWGPWPGECRDIKASSDRFALGFFDSSDDRYGPVRSYCYAYPSGKNDLQLSAWDYFTRANLGQAAAYARLAAIAAITGVAAWWLGSRGKRRSLKPWIKAAWFGAYITFLYATFIVMVDFEAGYELKFESFYWFVTVSRYSILLVCEPIAYAFPGLFQLLVVAVVWTMIGRGAGHLISFGRARLSKFQ